MSSTEQAKKRAHDEENDEEVVTEKKTKKGEEVIKDGADKGRPHKQILNNSFCTPVWVSVSIFRVL